MLKKKKRRSLARLLCSFIFHCKSNRHSLSSPFSLTTAMALATAARLSFLPLCLKIMSTVRRESGEEGGIPPLSCRRSVSMTIICIVQRLQTQEDAPATTQRLQLCGIFVQKCATSLFSVSVHEAAPVIYLLVCFLRQKKKKCIDRFVLQSYF